MSYYSHPFSHRPHPHAHPQHRDRGAIERPPLPAIYRTAPPGAAARPPPVPPSLGAGPGSRPPPYRSSYRPAHAHAHPYYEPPPYSYPYPPPRGGAPPPPSGHPHPYRPPPYPPYRQPPGGGAGGIRRPGAVPPPPAGPPGMHRHHPGSRPPTGAGPSFPPRRGGGGAGGRGRVYGGGGVGRRVRGSYADPEADEDGFVEILDEQREEEEEDDDEDDEDEDDAENEGKKKRKKKRETTRGGGGDRRDLAAAAAAVAAIPEVEKPHAALLTSVLETEDHDDFEQMLSQYENGIPHDEAQARERFGFVPHPHRDPRGGGGGGGGRPRFGRGGGGGGRSRGGPPWNRRGGGPRMDRHPGVYGDPAVRSHLLSRLDPEKRRLAEMNSHVIQALQHGGLEFHDEKRHGPFSRILRRTDPRTPYRRRKGDVKTVVHWGQRKLLLSEIEFLTLHAIEGECDVVIYAGAAPGAHTNYLSSLFPFVTFVLVDPSPFETRPTDKILLNPDSEKGFFTDELSRLYAEKYPSHLFVSDIRTASWKQMNETEIERHVMKDMEAQMRWVKLLKSKWAMLKFRLPYNNPESKEVIAEAAGDEEVEGAGIRYLDGDIFLPVWGPITTSETRLVTDGKKTRVYDLVEYEEQMFHFNTVTRTLLYDHCLMSNRRAQGLGIDRCFDCASEVRIVENYLKRFRPSYTPQDVLSMIENIDAHSSKGGRKLIFGNVPLRSLEITRTDRERQRMLLSLDTQKDSDLRTGSKRPRDAGDAEDETEPPKKRQKT